MEVFKKHKEIVWTKSEGKESRRRLSTVQLFPRNHILSLQQTIFLFNACGCCASFSYVLPADESFQQASDFPVLLTELHTGAVEVARTQKEALQRSVGWKEVQVLTARQA